MIRNANMFLSPLFFSVEMTLKTDLRPSFKCEATGSEGLAAKNYK